MEETCAPYNTEIWCSQGIHSFQILAQTANSGATALLKHKAWWLKKISQKERSSNRSAKSGDKDFVLILKLLECNRMHDISPRMKKTKSWSCFLLQQTTSCRYCILMWPHLSCFCIHPSTPVYPKDNPVPKISPTRKTLCRSVILTHMKVSFPPPPSSRHVFLWLPPLHVLSHLCVCLPLPALTFVAVAYFLFCCHHRPLQLQLLCSGAQCIFKQSIKF